MCHEQEGVGEGDSDSEVTKIDSASAHESGKKHRVSSCVFVPQVPTPYRTASLLRYPKSKIRSAVDQK